MKVSQTIFVILAIFVTGLPVLLGGCKKSDPGTAPAPVVTKKTEAEKEPSKSEDALPFTEIKYSFEVKVYSLQHTFMSDMETENQEFKDLLKISGKNSCLKYQYQQFENIVKNDWFKDLGKDLNLEIEIKYYLDPWTPQSTTMPWLKISYVSKTSRNLTIWGGYLSGESFRSKKDFSDGCLGFSKSAISNLIKDENLRLKTVL